MVWYDKRHRVYCWRFVIPNRSTSIRKTRNTTDWHPVLASLLLWFAIEKNNKVRHKTKQRQSISYQNVQIFRLMNANAKRLMGHKMMKKKIYKNPRKWIPMTVCIGMYIEMYMNVFERKKALLKIATYWFALKCFWNCNVNTIHIAIHFWLVLCCRFCFCMCIYVAIAVCCDW